MQLAAALLEVITYGAKNAHNFVFATCRLRRIFPRLLPVLGCFPGTVYEFFHIPALFQGRVPGLLVVAALRRLLVANAMPEPGGLVQEKGLFGK